MWHLDSSAITTYSPLPVGEARLITLPRTHSEKHGALCNHELPVTQTFSFILPKVQSFSFGEVWNYRKSTTTLYLDWCKFTCKNVTVRLVWDISRPPPPCTQQGGEYSARTLCSTDSIFESITANYGTLKQQKSDYIEADRSSITQMWHSDSAKSSTSQPSLERKHQPGWALPHGLITYTKFISRCCKWHEPS